MEGNCPSGVSVHKNFWRWTPRARKHYINKRYPGAMFIHNSIPDGLPDRRYESVCSHQVRDFSILPNPYLV